MEDKNSNSDAIKPCDNPISTNKNINETVKLDYDMDEYVYTNAGCSTIYSYSEPLDGTPTNYNVGLQLCNTNDTTRPPRLSDITTSNFCYNTSTANKDKYFFVSVKSTENGGKCVRYVYLTDIKNADIERGITFEGDCDEKDNIDEIINPPPELFTNINLSKKYRQKKSEEHFESNKNLKCKHRY